MSHAVYPTAGRKHTGLTLLIINGISTDGRTDALSWTRSEIQMSETHTREPRNTRAPSLSRARALGLCDSF